MMVLPDDLENAIAAFAGQQNITQNEAVQRILREWTRTHGFLSEKDGDAGSESAVPGKPDPEFVQYSGYFEGKGSV